MYFTAINKYKHLCIRDTFKITSDKSKQKLQNCSSNPQKGRARKKKNGKTEQTKTENTMVYLSPKISINKSHNPRKKILID